MVQNGTIINGKIKKFAVRCFICDNPAKCKVTSTHHHGHHNGCHKCKQISTWDGTRVYSTKVGILRTDESFFYRHDVDHHSSPHQVTHSRMEDSKFRMVTQFPIDVLHQIDLGVCKFLCYAYKDVLGNSKFIEMSNVFISFSEFTPREFARKPRPLHEMYNFKATEFRQIVLYTGIVLF